MDEKNQKLTDEQIKLTDEKFDEFLIDSKKKKIFLQTIFKYIDVDVEQQYTDLASYQRWHTFLVWPKIAQYTKEDSIIIFVNYFHIALLLGNNVWHDLLLLISARAYTLIEKVEFYEDVRKGLLGSKVIIAKTGNKNYTFFDLVSLYKDKIKNNKDVEGLKIILNSIIFCPDIEALDKYYIFEREKILMNYINLIDGILNVEKEQILKEIDKEFYSGIADKLKTIEEYKILVEESKKNVEPITKSIVEVETKPVEKPISAPTYSEIKAKILQFFPKDENGEIIDNEGVFEVLEKTAEKYGDPKIKETYYYDEESEKFKWNT